MAKASIAILLTIVLFATACSSGSDQAEPSTTKEASTAAESASQL